MKVVTEALVIGFLEILELDALHMVNLCEVDQKFRTFSNIGAAKGNLASIQRIMTAIKNNSFEGKEFFSEEEQAS